MKDKIKYSKQFYYFIFQIVQTLADLPISNRNTITKSKVLDIIAQWANIPLNIKEVIEK